MTDVELSKELYRKIYLIRMVEEKVREIYPSDVMKTPVHLSLGEESIVAGVCQALAPEDQVYGTYRTHALYLAKGGDLDDFFIELYGKSPGVAEGKAGSMHLSYPDAGFMASSAIVASIIPVALGAAFAAKYKGEDRITAVFFGDGAMEEGAFWESLNVAGLKKLPLLMVCQNNGLAIHAHIKDRQAFRISEAVKPFGLNVYSDETTDPERIFHTAREAIRFIKETGTPCFMHLKYHRYLEHVGVNEDYCFGYRCKDDYAHWYDADPVKVQRESLAAAGLDQEEIRSIEEAVDRMIEMSIEKAVAAGFPETGRLFRDVLA